MQYLRDTIIKTILVLPIEFEKTEHTLLAYS